MNQSPIEVSAEEWKDLPPHVQRMIEEENQLFDRLDKLEKFTQMSVFENLERDAQDDLIEQLGAMAIYLLTLRRRIAKVRNKK